MEHQIYNVSAVMIIFDIGSEISIPKCNCSWHILNLYLIFLCHSHATCSIKWSLILLQGDVTISMTSLCKRFMDIIARLVFPLFLSSIKTRLLVVWLIYISSEVYCCLHWCLYVCNHAFITQWLNAVRELIFQYSF